MGKRQRLGKGGGQRRQRLPDSLLRTGCSAVSFSTPRSGVWGNNYGVLSELSAGAVVVGLAEQVHEGRVDLVRQVASLQAAPLLGEGQA